MDFDHSIYHAGSHARSRAVDRVPEINWDNVDEKIEELAEEGTIIAEVRENEKRYRYLRNGDLFLPCVADSGYSFKVMSVMTWEMVKRNEQTTDIEALQHRLHRYHYQ